MKRKKKRILPIIIIVVVLIAIYSTLTTMPVSGATQKCNLDNTGNVVEVNGYDIWYKIYNYKSDNTPIYVIPGGNGFSSEYLEDSLDFLAEDHPVIFFDPRCSGNSEYTKDLSSCTFENYAKDLEALRNYLTPNKKIIVVAHSYAGATAMKYSIDYGNNLESMILISSVGSSKHIFLSNSYFKTGLPPINQTKSNKWYVDNISAMYGNYCENKDVLKSFKKTKFNYALMMKNAALDSYDYTDDLHNVNVPTLILVGNDKETPITNREIAKDLSKTIKNSKLYEFDNSGHFCFAEEPTKFKEVVNDFID